MGKPKRQTEEGQGPEAEVNQVNDDQKEIIIAPGAIIDVAVDVVSLDGDPFHKTGEEFQLGKKTAEELVKRGWVKLKETE